MATLKEKRLRKFSERLRAFSVGFSTSSIKWSRFRICITTTAVNRFWILVVEFFMPFEGLIGAACSKFSVISTTTHIRRMARNVLVAMGHLRACLSSTLFNLTEC